MLGVPRAGVGAAATRVATGWGARARRRLPRSCASVESGSVQVELGLVVRDELLSRDGVAERGDQFEPFALWMAGIYPASIASRASERSAGRRSCGCRERAYSCASAWPL